MNKISAKKLKNIEKNLDFYNFYKLTSKSQKQLIVKFKEEVSLVTYSDLQFDGDMDVYEDKEKILLNFLENLFKVMDETHCIIRKYNEEWVVNDKVLPELTAILAEESISNRHDGGIVVKKDSLIIKLFIQSVLRYNSFLQFVFKKDEIVISPSDHLDIFIDSRAVDNLDSKISKVIEIYGQGILELDK